MIWQYILYFFIYSSLGWVAEVCFAAVKEHRLVNRGFLNGPLCPVYGFGMVAMLVLLYPWKSSVLAVFLGGMVITTAIEWAAGWLLYRLFHARWWDYSGLPFNLGGFVCLPFSLLWGAASVVMVMAVHPPIARLSAAIPAGILRLIDVLLLALFSIDVAGSAAVAVGFTRRLRQLEEVRTALRRASDRLTRVVGGHALTADELWDEGRLQLALARLEGRDNAAEALAQLRARQAEAAARYRDVLERLQRHRLFGAGRLLRAFPQLRMPDLPEVLERLRRHLKK
ncbi:putative ABC transporter permease [uncultured Gemmiger sp.]|uniref:putative ABC transporter permease n=1 Tax=uncultured Gemmiger sp. TaxID=1623490 RepID=UPI0025DBA92B|nr:putative ABC transporter permease [uncultured Gemmiger sp.]